MKIWIADHTLCMDFAKSAYIVRPCSDLSGKFEFNGGEAPWFKVSTFQSKTKKAVWKLFAMPFLLVGVVKLS